MRDEGERFGRNEPTEAVEAVAVQVAAGGDGWRGEDGAPDPEERTSDDQCQDHDCRVQLDRVAQGYAARLESLAAVATRPEVPGA